MDFQLLKAATWVIDMHLKISDNLMSYPLRLRRAGLTPQSKWLDFFAIDSE